ncbi:dihydrofolate reductase family protein [Antrihabitans stalactiti]|uniref:Deaminase n=1 Tax=Antrihabitans stalactiti TaxID=2584121 RepID=A0A848K6S5_9NOCA|nr:dihydrofolate reductase family protein [Antrihabitans stalactiti]NMN94463.1 deaminase [Antrihabitans stalactiti]
MRKVIVFTITSLDGYTAGPGNNVMAMNMDNAFDSYCAERLGTADTLLLGRTSYEMFRGFWPAVVDNPDATPAQREISRRDNAIDKVVVSDTAAPDESLPWHDNTTIVTREAAHSHIADLKNQDGGDILIFGSRTLWNDLLANGLIDELHVMVGPAAVGDGTPAFDSTPALRPIDARTIAGSDNVLLTYQVGSPA